MILFPLHNKSVVVFGLARSGMAAVRWLLDQGATVYAADADDRKQKEACALGAKEFVLNKVQWNTIHAFIQSPGIPFSHPVTRLAQSHFVPVLGDCDLFRMANPHASIVGITGTNGKSTTTALVGHILKEAGMPVAIGGNIGVPVLSLPQLPAEGTYVLELSSYQLEMSHNLNLDYVGWLNITPDHLERHGTMDLYVQAKEKIFSHADDSPQIVMGIDDEFSHHLYRKFSRLYPKKVTAVSCDNSEEKGLKVQDGVLVKEDGEKSETIVDFRNFCRLSGKHNYQNMAIAYELCEKIGVPREKILSGIASFPGLAHRQEWVGSRDGVMFINDSKATNAESASKALMTYDHIFWIAGGQPKTDGIVSLKPYFSKIQHAFLIGAAQDTFAQTLDAETPYTLCGDLKTALEAAYASAKSFVQHTKKEDKNAVVLFSPACASFDQFRDFEQRGDVFRELVEKL